MREIPHSPVALYEVAHLFGTLVAETILASVHVRARKQAGHMGASDLIKALQNTLRGGGRPHTGNAGLTSGSASCLAGEPLTRSVAGSRSPSYEDAASREDSTPTEVLAGLVERVTF